MASPHDGRDPPLVGGEIVNERNAGPDATRRGMAGRDAVEAENSRTGDVGRRRARDDDEVGRDGEREESVAVRASKRTSRSLWNEAFRGRGNDDGDAQRRSGDHDDDDGDDRVDDARKSPSQLRKDDNGEDEDGDDELDPELDFPKTELILTERMDPSYEPTAEEVEEYATWLGMDLVEDADLLWIARDGLKEPLPANWKPCRSIDTKAIYFFNFATGESSWNHPCDEKFLAIYRQEKEKRKSLAAASTVTAPPPAVMPSSTSSSLGSSLPDQSKRTVNNAVVDGGLSREVTASSGAESSLKEPSSDVSARRATNNNGISTTVSTRSLSTHHQQETEHNQPPPPPPPLPPPSPATSATTTTEPPSAAEPSKSRRDESHKQEIRRIYAQIEDLRNDVLRSRADYKEASRREAEAEERAVAAENAMTIARERISRLQNELARMKSAQAEALATAHAQREELVRVYREMLEEERARVVKVEKRMERMRARMEHLSNSIMMMSATRGREETTRSSQQSFEQRITSHGDAKGVIGRRGEGFSGGRAARVGDERRSRPFRFEEVRPTGPGEEIQQEEEEERELRNRPRAMRNASTSLSSTASLGKSVEQRRLLKR